MMRHTIVHTLIAAAFGTWAATAAAQGIAPSQGDVPAAQTNTGQARLPAAKEGSSPNRPPASREDSSQDRLPASKDSSPQDRLPASKGESSDTQSSSDTSGEAGQPNATPPAKHPPTSVMDRATPTLNAPDEQSGRKHPPTSVMDSVTPQEKSPGANGSQDGSQIRSSK